MLTYSVFIYLLLVAIVKLSCLLLYSRLFSPNRMMKWFIFAGIYIIAGVYTGIFFGTVFECIPVQKSWHPELHGHCMRHSTLSYASGAINVLSDIYVLILPIPCVWQLNMEFYHKIRILLILGLGVLYDVSISSNICDSANLLCCSACATSIIRLRMTYKLDSRDTTWNLFQFTVWAWVFLKHLFSRCLG